MEADRGTLKTEHKIQLALAALSILPAGRGANIIKLGARSFGSWRRRAAGQRVPARRDRRRRDPQSAQLADHRPGQASRRHRAPARAKQSDPQLREMEYRADVLRDEIRNASFTVLEQLAKSQLLQMAPAKAIEHYAAKFSGAKAHPDDVDPARRPHVDDTPAPAANPARWATRSCRRASRQHAPRGRGHARRERARQHGARGVRARPRRARQERQIKAGRSARPTTFGCTPAPPS